MGNSFLQSPNGNYSSARLMFIAGLIYDMVMTAVGLLFLGWVVGEAIAFFSAIATVFIGLKLGQNSQENSELKIKENENTNT